MLSPLWRERLERSTGSNAPAVFGNCSLSGEEMMDEIEIDLTFKPKDELEVQEALALLEAEGAREVRKIEDYGLIDAGLYSFWQSFPLLPWSMPSSS